MKGAGPSQFLQQEKKSALRLLVDLYATNSTFGGFVQLALIGAVVLFFIHGLQSIAAFDLACGAGLVPQGHRYRM